MFILGRGGKIRNIFFENLFFLSSFFYIKGNLRRIALLTLIIFFLCFVYVFLIVIRFRFLQGYNSVIKL